MALSTKIQKFWVSFIWFETNFSFLDSPLPNLEKLPFSFLGRNYLYEEKFNEIVNNKLHQITSLTVGKGSVELTLPWKKSNVSQDFWVYYLGQIKERVTARQAWEKFVPLRGKWNSTIKATTGWPVPSPERIDLEAFYYPHGMGLVITFRCQLSDKGDLDAMVNLAYQIRHEGKFDLSPQSQDNKVTEAIPLNTVADNALDSLLNQAWGGRSDQPSRYITSPISIFTVTAGEQVDTPPPSKDAILHSLYAVSQWEKIAAGMPAPSDGAILPGMKKDDNDDFIYGPGPNGRAIWLPGTFLKSYGERALVSYHRNLVLASLQTASLCSLVYDSSKPLLDPNSPNSPSRTPTSPYQIDCLRRASLHLDELYTGDNSYSSHSIARQIEQNQNLLNAINAVKAYWNLPPLPTPQAAPAQPPPPPPEPIKVPAHA